MKISPITSKVGNMLVLLIRVHVGMSIRLEAPIATKVVRFSRLLKCLRSLYGKQCGPRSEQSDLGPPCLLLYLN